MNNEMVIGHSIYGIGPKSWGEPKVQWLCNIVSGVDGQADLALALRRAEEYRKGGFAYVVVYEHVRRPVDAAHLARCAEAREMQAKQEGLAND